MPDESNYSKREQDTWRSETKEQLNRIEDRGVTDSRTLADLARITSHNSGQIIALWKAHEDNKKANELIEDIIAFSKVVKWFVYVVIGAGALYGATKALIGGIFARFINVIFN